MILAAVVLLVVYSLVALAGYLTVPQTALAESEIPHSVLVTALFGEFWKIYSGGIGNNGYLQYHQYGFGHHPPNDVWHGPKRTITKLVYESTSETKTPWVGIVFVASLIMVPTILLRGQDDIILTLVISAATVWLVAYVIAHINLIVLRKRYPDFKRPFKSPWYPLPQVLGIIGMVYMI